MNEGLSVFMHKVFGEDGDYILNKVYQEVGIADIDLVTIETKKQFARTLRNYFKEHSYVRQTVLYAELLKVLNLDIYNQKNTIDDPEAIIYDEEGNEVRRKDADRKNHKYFDSKKDFIMFRVGRQSTAVNTFLEGVDQSIAKFEVIFNLFWNRAGEAELRGMKHEQVVEITNKAFEGVKEGISKTYEKVMKKFNLKHTPVIKNFKFEFVDFEKPKPKVKEAYPGEFKISDLIEVFKDKIELYERSLQRVFYISLSKNIDLQKSQESNQYLIEETQYDVRTIWKNVHEDYEDLKQEIDRIQLDAIKQVSHD